MLSDRCHAPHARRRGPERRSASACGSSDGQWPDPDGSRRRPLLEGVREPDRARQDASDDPRRSTWLAARLGVDREFLETASLGGDRMRVGEHGRRAPRRRSSRSDYEEGRRSSPPRLARDGPRLRSPAACSRRRIVGSHVSGRLREASRLLERGRASSPRTPRSPISTGRRSSTGSAAAATSCPRSRRRQACSAGARTGGALRASLRPAPRAHPRVALPVLPASTRLGGRPRGHRARARAGEGPRRPRDDRARVLPGLARRRAAGPVGARALLRRACEGALRGDRRPARASAGCSTTSAA